MKKNTIIISLVLLLLIVFFGSIACSRSLEGFDATLVKAQTTIDSLQKDVNLTASILIETGKHIIESPYCVRISHLSTLQILKNKTTKVTSTITSVSSDEITWTANGLTDGDKVFFSGAGTLTGIAKNTDYFVIDKKTNSFKISDTTGGAAKTLTPPVGNISCTKVIDTNWEVIWESNKSNTLWVGTTLKLTTTELQLGSAKIATGLTGANALKLVGGDLVIEDIAGISSIWTASKNLLESEAQSLKTELTSYIGGGYVTYDQTHRTNLNNKLSNYDTYATALSKLNSAKECKPDTLIVAVTIDKEDKFSFTDGGDLVIKKTDGKIIWSLLASETKSINDDIRKYLNKGSRIYSSTELTNLNTKITNYDTYVSNLPDSSTAFDLTTEYKELDKIRKKMDFEIGELNGKDGSKLAVSNNTLQSAMYLNVGITVLAASLFVLIATR